MQDVTPLTVAQEWSGYEGVLADDFDRIEDALKGVYRLAVGEHGQWAPESIQRRVSPGLGLVLAGCAGRRGRRVYAKALLCLASDLVFWAGRRESLTAMNHITMQRRARLLTSLVQQAANASPAPTSLDISAIHHFPVREPVSGNRYSLLRITTRSGLTGWGECGFDPNADFKAVESAWVGRPANAYSTIPPSSPFRAALDIASLDILGKAAKAPVYRVLGGPTRNKVRAYNSLHSEGSPVAVIDVPKPVSRNQGQAYQNRILELVNAVPADHDFVLVASGALTPGDAASVATTVESKHPLWFDEPCSHSNIDAVRKVANESVVPLGFGAGIDDPGAFQALLREGLIDLVRPEISIFGISGARRVAALAEPYYVAVAPRHSGGPLGTAAAIHLAASIPNFFIQNVPVPAADADRAMWREIVSPVFEISSSGFLELTKVPGLGITVNEAALEKFHAS